MIFAPATIAPGENLHRKHKPYHNPNPNPMLNKELEPEQMSFHRISGRRSQMGSRL